MGNKATDDVGRIIGIFSPWAVKGIRLSKSSESIVITLGKESEKHRFGFLNKSYQTGKVTRRWQHIKFGHFTTFIQATMSLEELSELTTQQPPAFLGAENKSITRELADSIRLAYSHHLNANTISSLLGIPHDIVVAEIEELNSQSNQSADTSLLPLESNPVWRDILTQQVKLGTKLLPLRLLLSRLQLNISKAPGNSEVVKKSIAELRQFFYQHANQLKAEYEKIGASPKKPLSQQTNQPQKLKLVLPSTNHPIWTGILKGTIKIETQNMPLKLALTQQQRVYLQAEHETDRTVAIRNLMMFFKHNARSLIPELKFLTQLVAEKQQSTKNHTIPPANDKLWQQLLSGEKILPSDKINYRLLLVSLKNSDLNPNKKNHSQQLHDFFQNNALAMKEEIVALNLLANN